MRFCGRIGTAPRADYSPAHRPVEFALGGPMRFYEGAGARLFHSARPITVEDEHERLPLTFADGRVLLFDGRLDDRDALRRKLGLSAGSRIVTDGELVAAAVDRWGDDAPRHLLGDFALAVWEPARRRLLLAADPVGARTVFHHTGTADGESFIVFGTTPASLQIFPNVPTDADDETLVRFLCHLPAEEGRTFFRAVHRLPLGGRLIWTDGAVRVDLVETLDWDREVRFRRDEDYVEAAREALDLAVRDRLRARAPIACSLSGGFDSGGVAATAARLCAPSVLHTITIVPDPAAPRPRASTYLQDEWSQAESVARRYENIVAHRVVADMPDESLMPIDFMRAVGQPLARPTQIPWFLSWRATLREIGADVLLIGGNGNGTLSWSAPSHLADLARGGRWWSVLQTIEARRRRGGWRAAVATTRSDVLLRLFPSLPVKALPSWHRRRVAPRFVPPLAVEVANELHRRKPHAPQTVFDNFRPAPALGVDRRLQRYVVDFHLHQHAPFRDFDGVERRDPYTDRRVIELCAAMPREQFLAAGHRRSLAVRTLADRLPQDVLLAPRRGRQCPEWFSRMNARYNRIVADVDRLTQSDRVAAIVDVPRLQRIVESWPRDADEAEPRFTELSHVLALGIAAGQFILWAEENAAR